MKVVSLSLPGLKLIELNSFLDHRGVFRESYRKLEYENLGIDCEFFQDNCSYSLQGVLRGMHFQNRCRQAKLVSVIRGEIFDVVVDIRPLSASFGKWEGVLLSENVPYKQLFIPPGFAHGFYVLSDGGAIVYYKISTPYDAQEERGFRFDDPDVDIKWPCHQPILSDKDRDACLLRELIL